MIHICNDTDIDKLMESICGNSSKIIIQLSVDLDWKNHWLRETSIIDITITSANDRMSLTNIQNMKSLINLCIEDVYLPTCPNLEKLGLQALRLHKNSLMYVEAGNYSTVEHLCINDNQLTDLDCLQYFPNLTRLICNNNLIKSIPIQASTINHIFLRNNRIDDLSLIATQPTYIKYIDLSSNHIRMSNMNDVLLLMRNRSISLNIANNPISSILNRISS